MTIKEYLRQLKKLDLQIDQMMAEKDGLQDQLTNISVQLKEIQVVSSGSMDPIGDTVVKIIGLERELDEKIDQLIDLKHRIIAQIHALDSPVQISVLYKRYVEYKTWEVIEDETNYSYQHLQRIHKNALKAFSRKHEIK